MLLSAFEENALSDDLCLIFFKRLGLDFLGLDKQSGLAFESTFLKYLVFYLDGL